MVYKDIGQCCAGMNNYTDMEYVEEKFVDYRMDTRFYGFFLFYADETYSGLVEQFFYCLWCGKKLPKTLEKERAEILKEEYGLTDDEMIEGSKVPEDFKTDKWWKDREL